VSRTKEEFEQRLWGYIRDFFKLARKRYAPALGRGRRALLPAVLCPSLWCPALLTASLRPSEAF